MCYYSLTNNGEQTMSSDKTIYIGFKGKLEKVAEPQGRIENANFVITWRGRQFAEIENRPVDQVDDFAVVER